MSASDTELRSAEGRVGPGDDRPLTEQEYQLLQRLLADPFSFPIQFKTWLVSYLETSDLSLPLSAVTGLTKILGISGVGAGTLGILPAGIILPYGGDSAPLGSKMCDGALYNRTTEDRLWKAIGTKWNIGGEAADSFRVPDFQERAPVGRGALSYHNAVGKTDGMPLGQRGMRHNHGTHAHTQKRENFSLTPGSTPYSLMPGGSPSDDGLTGATQVGPSSTPLDGPGFATCNFIITA